jgi:hypothetical protein
MMDRSKTDHCRGRKRRRRQGWWRLDLLIPGLIVFICTHPYFNFRKKKPPSPRVKATKSEATQLTLQIPLDDNNLPFLLQVGQSLQSSGCITAMYQFDLVQTAMKNTAGSFSLDCTYYRSLFFDG